LWSGGRAVTNAKQRDDYEVAAWMSEIRLRAMTRIGELSRELEKAKPDKGHGAGLPTTGKTKEEQLEAAGISTSAAQRYEKLAAPSEELVPVVTAAMENYFDEQAANKEVPTVRGLRGATVNGRWAKLKETGSLQSWL
jgi:hypothetical protein